LPASHIGTLETLTPLTKARDSLACAVEKATNSLIVSGGYSPDVLPLVERLDLRSNIFKEKQRLFMIFVESS
jgi:hypothetical protein